MEENQILNRLAEISNALSFLRESLPMPTNKVAAAAQARDITKVKDKVTSLADDIRKMGIREYGS